MVAKSHCISFILVLALKWSRMRIISALPGETLPKSSPNNSLVHWHKVTTERRSIVVFHCSMEWETKIEEPQLKKNQSKFTYLWSCTAKKQHSVLFNGRILAISNCTNWQDSAAHQPLLLLTSLKRCLLGDATVTGTVDASRWVISTNQKKCPRCNNQKSDQSREWHYWQL